ncbi:MAG: putative sugar O-methyltransferase [Candidatus Omnitrophica bacterium]|nr:putative sugar O-methyltransferase [Candidatus Omnitrophota bacterium]
MHHDDALIDRVEEELRAQAAHGLLTQGKTNLGSRWAKRVAEEPQRFITPDLRIKREALRNFRRDRIFVIEYGGVNLNPWLPRNWTGGRRGTRRRMIECLDTLKQCGDVELLKQYPCHPAGNPHIFRRDGYRYTYRWHTHIHYLNVLNRVLGPRLTRPFVALDLGCSYAIFSYLLASEYPQSRSILVDFPEQLLLAYYFLGSCLPEVRIAGVKELASVPAVTREVLQAYDVALVPVAWYQRIAPGTVDLFTNFFSLGEMTREWFTRYLSSPVFTTAQYVFTVNRFQSAPSYDSDLTILDYPVWDRKQCLHFQITPVTSHLYRRKRLFFYETVLYPSQSFEYIGRIGGEAMRPRPDRPSGDMAMAPVAGALDPNGASP